MVREPQESANNYGLPSRYTAQGAAATYIDTPSAALQYQPHVYHLAGHIFATAKLRRVFDIGCGALRAMRKVVPASAIVGVDVGQNLQTARRELPAASFIDHNLDAHEIALRPEELHDGMVVCSDVVEHLRRPHLLLNSLRRFAETAPFVLISTPDRTRCRGVGSMGPPANPAHIREWSADELHQLLTDTGLQPQLFGHTINTTAHLWKSTLLSIHGKHARYTPSPQRSCLAIISTYNDRDFLHSLVQHLLAQGVHMHFVDNWSDDGTFEWLSRAKQQWPDRIVGVERFPARGATQTYQWIPILERKAEIAAASRFDWACHYDSDELRESPWTGVPLADAVSFVDACGYNAIDHTVIDFRATEDGFGAETDARHFFKFFEFGTRPGHFEQIKCWKNSGQKVEFRSTGGHNAKFDGQKVFPLKFLLKHYALRSIRQMQKKIFVERNARRDGAEAAIGWHGQYDAYVKSERPIGLWNPRDLTPFNPSQFYHEYLVERLSSIGLKR